LFGCRSRAETLISSVYTRASNKDSSRKISEKLDGQSRNHQSRAIATSRRDEVFRTALPPRLPLLRFSEMHSATTGPATGCLTPRCPRRKTFARWPKRFPNRLPLPGNLRRARCCRACSICCFGWGFARWLERACCWHGVCLPLHAAGADWKSLDSGGTIGGISTHGSRISSLP
jgi:hypothetical protein